MYAAGNLADHVTRYNHKNQNRWLVQPVRPRSYEGAGMLMKAISMAMAAAGLIVTAVMMMQGVA